MVTQRVLVVLAITACAPVKPSSTRSSDAPENQALLTKIKPYMACLDDHSRRVFEIADGYRQRLGGKEPTTDMRVLLHASTDPKHCLEQIAEAKALQPASPVLESAGAAFAKALASVYALTTAGHDHFDRDSKTYDPAKGIALHGKLMAAFTEFDHAQAALGDEVSRIDLQVRRDQLTRTEQREGRSTVIVVDMMMLQAEEMMRFAVTPADRLDQLDLATLASELGSYEEAVAETSDRALAPPEPETDAEGIKTLVEHAQLYMVAIRQLIQRARDKVAYSPAEMIMIHANNERAVIGTPAAMADAYNRMVAVYYSK